jgi:hypothetical protein
MYYGVVVNRESLKRRFVHHCLMGCVLPILGCKEISARGKCYSQKCSVAVYYVKETDRVF